MIRFSPIYLANIHTPKLGRFNRSKTNRKLEWIGRDGRSGDRKEKSTTGLRTCTPILSTCSVRKTTIQSAFDRTSRTSILACSLLSTPGSQPFHNRVPLSTEGKKEPRKTYPYGAEGDLPGSKPTLRKGAGAIERESYVLFRESCGAVRARAHLELVKTSCCAVAAHESELFRMKRIEAG